MTRSKDRSEVEYLRGRVKELQSENRNLKKQLSRKEKREHQYEDLEEKLKEVELEEETEVFQEAARIKCPKCKGEIGQVAIGTRLLLKCESCGHRESKKNG
jgi:predicted nuclease with TOPRIM domain